jgi:hypothetical protein
VLYERAPLYGRESWAIVAAAQNSLPPLNAGLPPYSGKDLTPLLLTRNGESKALAALAALDDERKVDIDLLALPNHSLKIREWMMELRWREQKLGGHVKVKVSNARKVRSQEPASLDIADIDIAVRSTRPRKQRFRHTIAKRYPLIDDRDPRKEAEVRGMRRDALNEDEVRDRIKRKKQACKETLNSMREASMTRKYERKRSRK